MAQTVIVRVRAGLGCGLDRRLHADERHAELVAQPSDEARRHGVAGDHAPRRCRPPRSGVARSARLGSRRNLLELPGAVGHVLASLRKSTACWGSARSIAFTTDEPPTLESKTPIFTAPPGRARDGRRSRPLGVLDHERRGKAAGAYQASQQSCSRAAAQGASAGRGRPRPAPARGRRPPSARRARAPPPTSGCD